MSYPCKTTKNLLLHFGYFSSSAGPPSSVPKLCLPSEHALMKYWPKLPSSFWRDGPESRKEMIERYWSESRTTDPGSKLYQPWLAIQTCTRWVWTVVAFDSRRFVSSYQPLMYFLNPLLTSILVFLPWRICASKLLTSHAHPGKI